MDEEFDDNSYDLSEGMDQVDDYEDNPSDIPWGMIILAAAGGLLAFNYFKKPSITIPPAVTSASCVKISPTELPAYVSMGWQIYSISNSSSGGVLWACPPGIQPPE